MERGYSHHLIEPGRLARRLHRAFGFKFDETYKGLPSIQIWHNENGITISARTDDRIRKFTLFFGGKTLFTESWPHDGTHSLDSKITTIVFPDKKVIKLSEAFTPTPLTEPAQSFWLTGTEADEARITHKYMTQRVVSLIQNIVEQPLGPLRPGELALRKYREEESLGIEACGIEMGAFLSRRRAPQTRPDPT